MPIYFYAIPRSSNRPEGAPDVIRVRAGSPEDAERRAYEACMDSGFITVPTDLLIPTGELDEGEEDDLTAHWDFTGKSPFQVSDVEMAEVIGRAEDDTHLSIDELEQLDWKPLIAGATETEGTAVARQEFAADKDGEVSTEPVQLEIVRALTVGQVRGIVLPINHVFRMVQLPNDLDPEVRDAFQKMADIIADLEGQLSQLQGRYDELVHDYEALVTRLEEGMPLWRQMQDRYALEAAGAAGRATGNGVAFLLGVCARELLEVVAR